ncbi:sterile alpha motif domain-containing protein 9-like [Antennarius striatus]|uniref:sterile alpha motif domain-containing protein 9-like n=1 Tax=Antennarius striatus TaxID=241820 RepID=UPI0035B4D8A7
MRRSTMDQDPPLKKWTMKDVHLWLVTKVKVHKSCADVFYEEEVSGDNLVYYTKEDILDLGIKHGPAVKIMSYLQSMNKESQHKQDVPAYVENWTKEQVFQWLVQHVNVYGPYADRLQREDVSGDCLVHFSKQDFRDLEVKSGPATKILAELRNLKTKPEVTLKPNPDQRPAPNPTTTDLGPSQAAATKQETCDQLERKAGKTVEKECEKIQQTFQKTAGTENQQPKTWGAKKTESVVENVDQAHKSRTTAEIHDILEDLRKEDLKRFHFQLRLYRDSKHKPFSLSSLEDKDTMDTAALMTERYGSEGAFNVTKHILKEINQLDLVLQMEKSQGQQAHNFSKAVLKREANQGDKLRNLLTCGGNSLDNYDRFVVVVNKSAPEQIQHLQFLMKMKLFCVLDFNPDSECPGGLCHSYTQSRLANLHAPSQYQGQTDTVIGNLNLFKQTSWVFCNGRRNFDDDSSKELDYKDWLRKSCRHVEQLVGFICNPEVFRHGRILIIFLLLSPVDTEKDPFFDTYKCFIKHIEEESVINICESQDTYLKWRELIQDKCLYDIDKFSIYELNLSEISGTITALDPFGQPSRRLLPSSGSSAVVLTQKDVDFMMALDILCLNQCENIYDENSSEFHDLRIKVEEEFYKGGKVKWWNFYFCEKDRKKPFVKRYKFESLKKMVRAQLKDPSNVCDVINLFHNPGCGGTTLAMHVMWDLRQEVRCAVLIDNTLPKIEVAIQIRKLMQLESEKPSPVFLLVDDSKESDSINDLVNCIYKSELDSLNVSTSDAPTCKVVILNCVRSQSPKELYKKQGPVQSQYITASLTKEEQMEFEKKLKELKETHEKPENFYSFMFLKSNFDQKYVVDLARNTLENFDFSCKKDQLFAFLALLKTYEAKSEISLSLCEDFLGIKVIRWQDESVMDRMKPFSDFLIIDIGEKWGVCKIIRVLHQAIASACLEELDQSFSLKVSEITMEILLCDLFFSEGVVKDNFMFSVQQMLIERQLKQGGNDREPFSPLIDKIHNQQGRQTVQDIFAKASSRFVKSASIPQALARYLCIKVKDFPEALRWAEKAKKIVENPYTFDTIGQIHKTNLKANNQKEKQLKSQNPEDFNKNIHLAANAITTFKAAQELANAEDEPEVKGSEDELDDQPRRSYNVKGYVGVLEIIFLVFDMLGRLPFFDKSDPVKKMYLQTFLQKALPITSVFKEDNEINNRLEEIIREQESFLHTLKSEASEMFERLESYFTFIKRNSSEYDSKNRSTVSTLFREYVVLFCSKSEEMKRERQNNPRLNVQIDIEERRLLLEEKQANRFAGILQYLDKPNTKDIEWITTCYAFLQQQQQFVDKKQKTRDTTNYILSNIILYLFNPKSKLVKSHSQLSALLQRTLDDVGRWYPFPDPYYLALLLFWPSPSQENTDIRTYINSIQKSSRQRLALFPNRNAVAHFYLGKGNGLKRLISKPQLDENFTDIPRNTLAQNWRNGHIFKEKEIMKCLQRVNGTIEQGDVFANYGGLKIPVRPALIGGIRSGYSTEKVSFYVGFAIKGPLAYDIQQEK